MSVATEEKKTSGSFMRALSTGKGINAPTASNGQAAARAAQSSPIAEPPATVQPTATTQQTAPAPVQTPSVTTVPLTTPEVPPVAAQPIQATPLVQSMSNHAEPVAQPQAAPLVPESQRRVIKVDSDETLIQFPGEQPKTRAQINFERKQGQDLDRKMNELQNRERQVAERERVLAVQPAMAPQPLTQPAPHTQPVQQPLVAQPMPMPPKDAIEGDPEWTKYQAEVVQWAVKNAMPEVMKPILEFTESQKQAQANQQAQIAQRAANFAQNAPLIESIPQYLPFDVTALPEDVQTEVWRQIVLAGQKEGVNLADKELPYQAPINPYFLKYVATTAFPAGSLPPGYSYQEIPPTPALDALPPLGTPLVPKAPLSPPLQAGVQGLAAPPQIAMAPGRKPSFFQKLGQTRE